MANLQHNPHGVGSNGIDLDDKTAFENVEHYSGVGNGTQAVMRTKEDDMSVWQAVKAYKKVTALAMAAAFCASLDGYQISLNGGIVSNAGFVKQFATVAAAKGSKILDSKYVSAWGGIQSAGQFVGQVVGSLESCNEPLLTDVRTGLAICY